MLSNLYPQSRCETKKQPAGNARLESQLCTHLSGLHVSILYVSCSYYYYYRIEYEVELTRLLMLLHESGSSWACVLISQTLVMTLIAQDEQDWILSLLVQLDLSGFYPGPLILKCNIHNTYYLTWNVSDIDVYVLQRKCYGNIHSFYHNM